MKQFIKCLPLICLLLIGNLTYAQDEPVCEEGFRIVEHEILESPICVPENPQQIVAQHLNAFELMLMLDMQPAARPADEYLGAVYGGSPAVFDHVMETVEEIPVFGVFDVNTEVLLEIQPDLVIVYPGLLQNIDQLREFTTVIESPIAGDQPNEWSVVSDFFAEVMGVSEEYDALMEEYNERMASFQELKDPVYDGMSLVYVQDAAGTNYVGLPGLPLWETILDAGFVPVDTLPTTAEESLEQFGSLIVELSEEQVSLLNADVLVIVNGNVNQDDHDTATAVIEGYLSDPLWATLDAVQNERIFAKAVYWQSNGFVSAHTVLDDMFTDFAGVDPDEVAPNPFLVENTDDMSAGTAFPLSVEHELGTTTIEAVPERIVVLEYSFADHLGTLGIVPVGFAVDAPPEYIYAYTSDLGAIEVGTRAEPNLEAILELNPDFIIADLNRHEAIYDQLSLIAPTVVFNSLRGSYDDQLEQFSIIAEIVNQEDEAATILASYQENFDAASATTNPDAGEFIIGVLWSGGFTAHSNESFMGSFLENLGRSNALEPREGETQFLLDMEGFASINPASIVILCNPADQEFLDDMTGAALWQAFDAVSNNRVYSFDRNLWSKGRGITAYDMILTDALNSGLLTDAESQSTVCGGTS